MARDREPAAPAPAIPDGSHTEPTPADMRKVWYRRDDMDAVLGFDTNFKSKILTNEEQTDENVNVKCIFTTRSVTPENITQYLNNEVFAESGATLSTLRANEKIKILMPYLADSHWYTCEVVITKSAQREPEATLTPSFEIKTILHDPKGQGIFTDEIHRGLTTAVSQGLNNAFEYAGVPQFTFLNTASTGNERQLAVDNNSCGPIAAADFAKLLAGSSLDVEAPLNEVAIEILRQADKEKVRLRLGADCHVFKRLSGRAALAFDNVMQYMDAPEHQAFVARELHELAPLKLKLEQSENGTLTYTISPEQRVSISKKPLVGGQIGQLAIGVPNSGNYIVTVQRVDQLGNITQNCKDVLCYRDGVLAQKTTIGNIANTFSRVEAEMSNGIEVRRGHAQRVVAGREAAVPAGAAAAVPAGL